VDTLVGGTGLDWSLALSTDTVAKNSNETLTVIP
jgi:hypothetical protein